MPSNLREPLSFFKENYQAPLRKSIVFYLETQVWLEHWGCGRFSGGSGTGAFSGTKAQRLLVILTRSL
jgi:hypothetical protein